MSDKLTHINDKGEAHMVDVSDREETIRTATAAGKVLLSKEVLALIADGTAPKGDVLATALSSVAQIHHPTHTLHSLQC